jgi:hypothetical protein
MIQRYHMIGQVTQIADDTGNWVKYSDHASELSHMDRRCDAMTRKATDLAIELAVFDGAPSIQQVMELQKYYDGIESYMIATGRHKPLSDDFLARVQPVWEWLRRIAEKVGGG